MANIGPCHLPVAKTLLLAKYRLAFSVLDFLDPRDIVQHVPR